LALTRSPTSGHPNAPTDSLVDTWYEDVHAPGQLRPPWALAFDELIAARQPND
jgi:hypothetical protein